MILQKITNDIQRLSEEWDNLGMLRYRRMPNYSRYVSQDKMQQIREGNGMVHAFVWRGQAIFRTRMSLAGQNDFIGVAHYLIPDNIEDIERYVLETDAPIELWNIL